jgi:hypothetical protein
MGTPLVIPSCPFPRASSGRPFARVSEAAAKLCPVVPGSGGRLAAVTSFRLRSPMMNDSNLSDNRLVLIDVLLEANKDLPNFLRWSQIGCDLRQKLVRRHAGGSCEARLLREIALADHLGENPNAWRIRQQRTSPHT